MRVLSLQVGRISPVGGEGPALRSGIDKRPVAHALRLGRLGFPGDEIADARFHGGEARAAMAFSHGQYARVEALLGSRLAPGSFGENLTVEGFDEATVRVGDVWRVGAATVEVTSPRMPCGTLARHLGLPAVVETLLAPHRAGWYLRVLVEGDVRAGDRIEVLRRGDERATIERLAAARRDDADVESARLFATLPALETSWARRFADRAARA